MFNLESAIVKRCCHGRLCEPNGATVQGRISIDVANRLEAQVPARFRAEAFFVIGVIEVSSFYYADSEILTVVWGLLFAAQRDTQVALPAALPVYV